jgi:hypothetical protein
MKKILEGWLNVCGEDTIISPDTGYNPRNSKNLLEELDDFDVHKVRITIEEIEQEELNE